MTVKEDNTAPKPFSIPVKLLAEVFPALSKLLLESYKK